MSIKLNLEALIDDKTLQQTERGLEFCMGSVALQQNIDLYPSYRDLLKEHSQHFQIPINLTSL